MSTLVFGALHLFSKGGQQNLAEQLLYLLPATAFGFLAAVLLLLRRRGLLQRAIVFAD